MTINSAWLAAGGPVVPGMRAPDGWICAVRTPAEGAPMEALILRDDGEIANWEPVAWIDIDEQDPATVGAMLGEVRRLYGDPDAYVRTQDFAGRKRYTLYVMQTDGFRSERGPCVDDESGAHIDGDSEAAALAAAWKVRA